MTVTVIPAAVLPAVVLVLLLRQPGTGCLAGRRHLLVAGGTELTGLVQGSLVLRDVLLRVYPDEELAEGARKSALVVFEQVALRWPDNIPAVAVRVRLDGTVTGDAGVALEYLQVA